MIYQLLNSEIELGDNETPSKLYVNWDNDKVRYVTTDLDGTNHQYFESTVHSEKLNKEQRYRVLRYCLSVFDENEIVDHNDLFLQNEFIVESNIPKKYSLTDEYKMS
jgi:hypothetical protein